MESEIQKLEKDIVEAEGELIEKLPMEIAHKLRDFEQQKKLQPSAAAAAGDDPPVAIAPPRLPGHPGTPTAQKKLAPLFNLGGHKFSDGRIRDMFPTFEFDGSVAFAWNSDPETTFVDIFGVKCKAYMAGTCTKSDADCEHTLESAEAVRNELMAMPDEQLLDIYKQTKGVLLDAFRGVYAEVFSSRGLELL